MLLAYSRFPFFRKHFLPRRPQLEEVRAAPSDAANAGEKPLPDSRGITLVRSFREFAHFEAGLASEPVISA